jgi:hypothetical protein
VSLSASKQIVLDNVLELFRDTDPVDRTLSQWRNDLQGYMIDVVCELYRLIHEEVPTNAEYYRQLTNMAVACLLAMDDLRRRGLDRS